MIESIKNKKKRIASIISILKDEYPDSKCSLIFNSPFQLLVATVLSAQCTDERVNKVTKTLFKRYPDSESFSKLSVKQIGKLVYSTGFYNNKAKNIKKMADIVWHEYHGIIPDDIDKLVELPGVGRKTANVVLGNYYSIPSLVVDTHVTRITNLLGMTKSRNAVIIERNLQKIVHKRDWVIFTHLIIDHGRAVCRARSPLCINCQISNLCPSKKI